MVFITELHLLMESQNGPFCPKCYEGSPKKLSSVMQATGINAHFGSKYCHACQSHF
ncbi:hypothetical protein KPLM21_20009 [Klebsiella pneumoniae]|nr:hypothetical protein KPLM21_20009 [Klebsiella pneumoniae]